MDLDGLEEGSERVSASRLQQATETGAETLAVGCPFCMVMLNDAATTSDSALQLKDVAEIVEERMKK